MSVNSAVIRRCQNIILFGAALITLIVTPAWNLDPINLPKYAVLLICSGALAGYLLPTFKGLPRSVWVASSLFVVSLSSTLIFSGADFSNQIFGTFGRNTGFLTYFALVILFVSTVAVTRSGFSAKLVYYLLTIGLLMVLYGLVQWAELDPVNWNNPYNRILGTLGNPNFTSAFLGIVSVAAVALLLDSVTQTALRMGLGALVLLAIFLILNSDATQGLFLVFSGTGILIYLKFVRFTGSKGLKLSYLASSLFVIFLGIQGLLQKGPLSSILYQESVSYRGDYWRAGISMTLDEPFTGVGLDSYGDWYRSARDQVAALRRGPDVVSNSAHNVFLDLSSNGGIPLLLSYLLICALTVVSAVRLLKRETKYVGFSSALVVAWIGYVIQSIISINQIGLAIWGWLLSGAIIGHDYYGNLQMEKISPKQRATDFRRISPALLLTGTLGIVVASVPAYLPVAKDWNFKSALQSGDAEAIKSSALGYPASAYYLNYAGDVLQQNKLDDQALEMARKSIAINPRDFNGWKLLISNATLNESERQRAVAEMKKLDPFNNTLGQ